MAKFHYIALDGRGKEQKGRVEAENEQDASSKLKQMGLFPTSISQARGQRGGKPGRAAPGAAGRKVGGGKRSFGGGSIRKKKLTTFTRQLATLLDAGLPLVRALRTLERQAKGDPGVRKVVGNLASTVEAGSTFSEALSGHPRSFSKLYVSMVRAGEASGALETVLNRLAEFMEKAQRVAGKVKAALVYPLVVLVVAGGITTGLMVFIVPKFAKIFADMLPGEDLPGLTLFVINTSNLIRDRSLLVIGCVVAGIIVLKLLRRTRAGAYTMDYILVKLPPINDLVIKSTVSRFCRTLGTLMQSGVAVLQALQIVRDTAGNEVVSRAIQSVHDAVKEGEGMTKPLEAANIFPGMVVSMVEVGEETGALPEMLNRVADTYDEEVDRAVEALTSLIEPAMIVVMAVIIGTIVIALFLPLIKLMDKLGGA